MYFRHFHGCSPRIALGNIKMHYTLWLLQQRGSNYCSNIALKYFTILSRTHVQHHHTYVALVSTRVSGMNTSLLGSMNLWVCISSTFGINLICTLGVLYIIWQYSVIYCTCDIIIMWILILCALIFQGGDNVNLTCG